MNGASLGSLAWNFAFLSLFAIGGGISAIPEMHHYAVELNHFMTDRQFLDMFALAQLSPGPNILIVALIGYHVAGLAGAAVATAAMCGPPAVLSYFAGAIWERYKRSRWRIIAQDTLVPVAVALVAAGGAVLAYTASTTWVAFAVAAGTFVVSVATRLNPLWVIAAGGALGYLGFI